MPHAFVLLASDDAGENQTVPIVSQRVAETVSVVVAFDNTLNQRGQDAAEAAEAMKKSLWTALLGWSPAAATFDGFEYGGGRQIKVDRARLWWQFDFVTQRYIQSN